MIKNEIEVLLIIMIHVQYVNAWYNYIFINIQFYVNVYERLIKIQQEGNIMLANSIYPSYNGSTM